MGKFKNATNRQKQQAKKKVGGNLTAAARKKNNVKIVATAVKGHTTSQRQRGTAASPTPLPPSPLWRWEKDGCVHATSKQKSESFASDCNFVEVWSGRCKRNFKLPSKNNNIASRQGGGEKHEKCALHPVVATKTNKDQALQQTNTICRKVHKQMS